MYPITHDKDFELKLSFAQKVYSIITFQLLLTIVVVSILHFVPPIANFFIFVPNYVLCTISFFASIPIQYYQHQKHRLSYLFLLISTLSSALFVGSFCTSTSGKTILDATTLTTMVLSSLTIYAFKTTKRMFSFSYFSTFLIGSIFVLVLLILVEILYPSGHFLIMIYGWLVSIILYLYIVYHTDNLIKRSTYTKYISVSVYSYLAVMFIFMCVLGIFWCFGID